jgi:uncharacterized membrane protein YcaP (DUF421 family)
MHQWLIEVFSYPSIPTSLGIAAKTTVIYLFVVIGIRILGTRELGEMTIYDFVLVVVISNAVQNALVGGDTTLVGGLISALTMLIINRLFTLFMTRFKWFEHAMVGEPVVLVNSGRVQWEHMKRQGVDRDTLMAGLREHGVLDLNDVQLAVLEIDGTISVVPKGSTVHRTRRPVRGIKAA